ncbi:MAG: hypothetical protein AB7O57_13730 [Hyphomicrobiaceae bacterium]
MCLSIYLGCNSPLEQADVVENGLGAEPASWTPPPLAGSSHAYYLGRKGKGAALECSCLLAEQIDWCDTPPTVRSDPLYPEAGLCPFETLQRYVEQVLARDGFAILACDDSGGTRQDCSKDDYHELPIRPGVATSCFRAWPVKFPGALFSSLLDDGCVSLSWRAVRAAEG